MKRKLALGLILTTVLSINTVGVFANERVEQISGNVFSIIQPRLSIIDEIGNTLTIGSTGKATLKSTVIGLSGTTKVAMVATLQKYSNGSWVAVKTFTDSTNSTRLTASNSYTVTKGYNYRVKLTATAYKGSDYETVTTYSNESKH